jgi:S-adenosylmethionine:tRNA ribosyltransferase-isomerase
VETSAFDFELPGGLIAQHPVEPRDRSRLMVVRRAERRVEHRAFADLPGLLAPGDVLVRNDTKVVPARLVGRREATGGRWEGLFLRALGSGDWEILATTRGKPVPGERVVVREDEWGPRDALRLTLVEKGEDGRWVVRPEQGDTPQALLERYGRVPLPPYIRKGVEGPGDRRRYQTLFARVPGSVAAPTAGLHFTDEVFRRLAGRDITVVDLTLHVGLGTFRPIEAGSIEDHVMHAEYAELTAGAADVLNARRASGGKIVAVGTTSARVLETAADASGVIRPFAGETALYIRPGHEFRGLDALVTNFHLPRSSLLVLVSALAGVELTHAAYAEAVKEEYRFYSYGDAMLIV